MAIQPRRLSNTGGEVVVAAERQAALRQTTVVPRQDDDRQRQLVRLRAEVTRVREALTRVQEAARRFAEIEGARRLTADERAHLSALRVESEALLLETRLFRQEFERLRAEGSAQEG